MADSPAKLRLIVVHYRDVVFYALNQSPAADIQLCLQVKGVSFDILNEAVHTNYVIQKQEAKAEEEDKGKQEEEEEEEESIDEEEKQMQLYIKPADKVECK